MANFPSADIQNILKSEGHLLIIIKPNVILKFSTMIY